MFTAPMRALPYPLDRASNLEVLSPNGEVPCGLPAWPEDSDEKITVLFRLSLNQFVALATAIDVGSDIAYSTDGIKIWELWVASVMCASFCEEMAGCLTAENPAVVGALANLIASNPAIISAISNSITSAGGAIPGQSLPTNQAETNLLPPEVINPEGECDLNALWGACLYMVQAANRAITDFFEITEAATNSTELAGIVAQNVPAAGQYAASALEFADQIQETLQEGYAGAYTETYENELACAIFCAARSACDLNADMLVQVLEQRLGYVEGTINFGVLMTRIGTGAFIGSGIADAAFYIYFSALRFGQQFGDVIGFRPLIDMMSLGADLLASDNWIVLCDCPEGYEVEFDFTAGEQGFVSSTRNEFFNATYVPGAGWIHVATDTSGGADISFEIWHDFISAGDVTRIEIDYVLSNQGNSVNQVAVTEFDTSSSSTPGTNVFNDNSGSMTGENTYIWTGATALTAGGFSLAMLSYVVPNPTDSVLVTAIRFYGNVNPFE